MVRHPAVLGRLAAGPVVVLATDALVPEHHVAPGTTAASLRALAGLPVAVPPRAHGPPAHDLLIDTLEERGLPVRVLPAEDERAALALVAAGQAVAFTADPALSAPRVVRVVISGSPVPLRLRLVWREPAPPAAVLDGLAAALTAMQPEAARR